ncbi:MAG: hypothetical protein ACFFAE_16270 [Candidatus Hodarchaeota archaeon]
MVRIFFLSWRISYEQTVSLSLFSFLKVLLLKRKNFFRIYFLLLAMDFPTLHQHIDALLEQERCADAQIIIDEQLNHPKYSVLTNISQANLPLWEEMC